MFDKIDLKVYDVSNCLNKILITQFVWYLRKEKRNGIETLSIERVLSSIFMEKSCRNYAPKHQKPVQETFLVLVKEGYEKAFKKLTLFFLLNPISFNEQDHEKQKEPETSD